MKRGDLVTIALSGDYGKPRPALVIQSDLFDVHPSITILPVTSELREAPLFRVRIEPTHDNGLRKTSESKMGPPTTMLTIGKAANDAEVKAAAEYFASIKPKPWIKVIETKMVPKAHVSGWMFVETEGAEKGMEPIGSRVIEMPVDLERTELRDSKSSFIAYAPIGSIKKGEALVTTGGAGKTIKCSICHGADLKGIGNVPSISGRSPSYIARQLYDIQQGNRNGPWTQLMKEAVAKLTVDDMVSITAYLASRNP